MSRLLLVFSVKGHRAKTKETSERMSLLFCGCPQVLLFAPSHIARKGECEGETFAGFPTRVQSPARRRPILRSKIAAPKKYDHPKGGRIFLVREAGLELLQGNFASC